jgi:2-iminobutanoate/2-iminopropanoate deaminase
MARTISTRDAPAPVGPYSQAIVHQGIVYCSGQIGIDPLDGTIPESVEAQTWRCLANLDAVLHATGVPKDRVLRCTIYVVDLKDFATVNSVYADFFGDARPARTTVQVAALPRGALVEIDAIAAV